MHINSEYTGSRLKAFTMTVTPRQIMNYAAGLGDANPYYLDDERAGGIVAPPMFAAAVTWQMSRRIWEFLDAPGFPMQVFTTQVHYSEHLKIHRLMRPGDKLVVTGEIAAIIPHRSGTHLAVRYDAVDKKGTPLFTEHAGVMLRGVACADSGRGRDRLPGIPEAPGAGAVCWTERIRIHALAAPVYDACADIHFPIHTSPQFARSVGLPGIILQGTATLAHAARCIVNHEAQGNPAALRELSCGFAGLVCPGSEIALTVNAETGGPSERHVFFHITNAENKTAIRSGYARLSAPAE